MLQRITIFSVPRTSIETLFECTVRVPTSCGTMSALPFMSPPPAASGSNLGLPMISASLSDFTHCGYDGVHLREARNLGSVTHDRDRAAEERNARQRRINDAGDSGPGSQDSSVRRVHNLQLGSRRPPQLPPGQQPREYCRCAQSGPDPSAFRGASHHGLMLHIVQKH